MSLSVRCAEHKDVTIAVVRIDVFAIKTVSRSTRTRLSFPDKLCATWNNKIILYTSDFFSLLRLLCARIDLQPRASETNVFSHLLPLDALKRPFPTVSVRFFKLMRIYNNSRKFSCKYPIIRHFHSTITGGVKTKFALKSRDINAFKETFTGMADDIKLFVKNYRFRN